MNSGEYLQVLDSPKYDGKPSAIDLMASPYFDSAFQGDVQ